MFDVPAFLRPRCECIAMIGAVERAAARNDRDAQVLMRRRDYGAEFFSEDAKMLREVIPLIEAKHKEHK